MDFYGVHFLTAQKGIAVGEFGIIRVTSDGGATWTSQASLTTDTLLAVHFYDELHGTAVGTQGTIIATTDGGATWEAQVSGTTKRLNEVFYSSADRIVVVGEGGLVLTKTLGGRDGCCRREPAVDVRAFTELPESIQSIHNHPIPGPRGNHGADCRV